MQRKRRKVQLRRELGLYSAARFQRHVATRLFDLRAMSGCVVLRLVASGCARRSVSMVLPWGVVSAVPWQGLHGGGALWAGHNKWSKVKDIKIPKDAARARMTAKYAMMIRVAVREGGPNPQFNVALAQLIEQCKSKNLPKATIEAAIKGAEKAKGGVQQLYEARGPGGCMLLIEVLTDNASRTHQEIKKILSSNGGALCDGARHNFVRKGVVLAEGDGVSPERALELAIEAGAEDVHETEEEEEEEERKILQFICDIGSSRAVRAALEAAGVRTLSTGVEFISVTHAMLPTAQLCASAALLEAINHCPNVIKVWDNVQETQE